MEEMKEFENIKSLLAFMVKNAENPLYEGGAVLQGEYVELMVDSPEEKGFTLWDYDGGSNIRVCFTKKQQGYNAIIPASMEYDIKEAIAEYM